MDKNAIKKYAIWARNELIARIAQKALRYGISKDSIVDAYADSIDGVLLSAVEKRQRHALITQIEAKGFEQVVEEVAYTWFNRFCALRFMEVNGYLPSNIRVLSDEGNNFKPEILTKAIELDFESLNMETVYSLKEANKDEELYRYLLIVQCNELNKILPHMFQKLEDYTELLLPDNLLREGSVVEQLVTTIPQEDFDINKGGQVEIIGWLYQYYNTEPKAETFALLKKNVKITKERIPSATQLFTPDWIVRYMVENSLGRIWVEGHPNDELKGNWKYYLDEAKQEEAVEAELAKIRAEYANLNPKDIEVIDPCMGSGHILIYAFDVLMQIYTSVGYTEKEAAISILENNLYGLDIDERAFQLAYFAVMMKARQYHKFILKKQVQCNIHPIVESNGINVEQLHYFGVQLDEFSKKAAITQMQGLISQMHDAKEYGSIINVDNYDWELLRQFVDEYDVSNGFDLFNANGIEETQQRLKKLIAVGELFDRKYYIAITNPPYLSARGGINTILMKYLLKKYPTSKNDLFTVFMEVCNRMLKKNGYFSMINQHSWMFLSGFDKLRAQIYEKSMIINLVHIGSGAFEGIAGEVVQSVVFTIKNNTNKFYKACYLKLTDGKWKQHVNGFPNGINKYVISFNELNKIPNGILCYWISEIAIEKYYSGKRLDFYADPRVGMATGNNDLFLRLWYEVDFYNIGIGVHSGEETERRKEKWYPYNKGGEYRRWYGNRAHIVDWYHNGENIYSYKQERLLNVEIEKKNSECWNREYYFMESLSWSKVSTSRFAVRYYESGFIFDVAGCSILGLNSNIFYIMGALNSELRNFYIESLSPTLNFETGALKAFPIIENSNKKVTIENFVKKCIELEKKDWDNFETSWDFKKHPLV